MKKNNKILLKYIGERLQTFREERGISRDMAADMIGVTPRTLASYERGEREITTDRVEKMALAYKTTFTNLTNYKNVLTEINA
ncbi:MAG: helix-turn-helix transcriptional regulator [Clostridia bacterium]|nr:helix-turn-helix transcriptional regulator [Clostridia bacterium]MEE0410753.1 helix-turn-helix transcriptional regulator [Clostridia bacterium]